jgi:ribose 5-phosphate isomerase RpiB
VLDLGTHSIGPVDYSDYAEAVDRALRENQAERGILLCGRGGWRINGGEQDSRDSRRIVP